MYFERDTHGDWVVDPEQLASRPGINPGHLRHEMRLGSPLALAASDPRRSRMAAISGSRAD